MTDLALNEVTRDLADPVVLVSGVAAVRQALQIRLGFFRNEWFLDLDAGLPYYQQILIKHPKGTVAVDALFKAEILATPNVRQLLSFRGRFEPGRLYVVDFKVDTDFGTLEEQWQASP